MRTRKKSILFYLKTSLACEILHLYTNPTVTVNVAQFITRSPSLLQSETVLANTVRPFIVSELHFLATMDSTLSLSAQITFRVSQDPIEGRICHSLHIINLETPWINDEHAAPCSQGQELRLQRTRRPTCASAVIKASSRGHSCVLSVCCQSQNHVSTHTHTHLHPVIDVCTAAAELLTEYVCSSVYRSVHESVASFSVCMITAKGSKHLLSGFSRRK